jgi:hypothetical protein
MFDKSEILARLQNGDTVDDIAAEMTSALNAAHKDYIEEAKRMEEVRIREERKMQEAARKEEAKREAMYMMIEGMCDYLSADSGNEDLIHELQNTDFDKLMEGFDSIVDMAKSLANVRTLEFKVPDKSINWNLFSKLF